MGRPPLKASGPMTDADRARRYRRKVARQKKLANPRLKAKQERRSERERLTATKILTLPTKRYGVIYADPEWRFEVWSRLTGMDRAADNHYSTSAADVIKSRDVASIATHDCVLFLWATAPMSPQAFEVMAAWGFTYKTQVVWVKDRVGTGYWFRNQHELLLIGTRGDIPAPAPGTQWPSVVHAPVGRHSEKPAIFYELIEAYYPTLPKIELNARKRRPGWDTWGAETPVLATVSDEQATLLKAGTAP